MESIKDTSCSITWNKKAQCVRVTCSAHWSHSERLGGCAELAAGSWVSALSTGPRSWSAALDKVLIEQNKTILNFATSSKSLPYGMTCAESRAWDRTMSLGPITQATPISCVA